ncbi:MAG: PAS domain S-box protein, partial [Phycisphaerae bacterium]
MSLWRQWFLKNNEEISPWVGLSFGALYFVAIAAVGAAALRVQERELREERLARMAQWAEAFSRHLSLARKESPEAVAVEVRRAGREDGVRWCAVTCSEGTYIAHSDADQVGKRAGVLVANSTASNGVQIAADPDRPGSQILIAKLAGPSGTTKGEELRVGLAQAPFVWSQSEVLIWAGYALPLVLALFLICYRVLRRAITPLAAIRQRLMSCQEPVAEQLLALRMNDSFDQISVSWNRLIDFVSEMQEQLRRTRLNTDMSAAMDAFHSERLIHILMQLPFGVMVIDGEGTVGFANRTAAGMVGQGGEPLEGKAASTIFDAALHMSLLSGAAGSRPGAAAGRWIDHTFKRPHGDTTLRFWSLPSELGGRDHILIIQDVTQAKEAERARDNFLYHVTHELRTPLTNIRAYAETLSTGVIDDEQTLRECYNVIMGETQRLNRL